MERRLDVKGDVDLPRTSDSGPERLGEAGSVPTEEEKKRERVLIRKIDQHVLPFVVLLYLFSFLDRGLSWLTHPVK